MEFVKKFDKLVNESISPFFKPRVVKAVVHLLIILYATRLAPTLPQAVLQVFENAYFKLFVFALILWTAQFSPSTSLLIALAFMMTVNFMNKKPLWEFMNDTTTTPLAPTKDVAIASTVGSLDKQSTLTPVVTSITQSSETIVVQPKIVTTPSGQSVLTPTVVVAPAVVSTPSGDKILVSPDVSTIQMNNQQPQQQQQQQSACYPRRATDMAKVEGVNDMFPGEFPQPWTA